MEGHLMKKMRRKLPPWLESIEHFVDRAIPYILILLLFMIVAEFTHYAAEYEEYLIYLDYFIISFFIIDLCFKWYHVHNAVKFIKLYWLDLIAVFPFYTFFRTYTAATELLAAGEPIQQVLHESVLVKETKLLQGARFAKGTRIVQIFARSLRLLRARWYVTHWHMHAVSREHLKYHKR